MPHTSRRALATMLHDVGVPIAHNADHLGHADTAMTASVYPGRDFMGGRSSVAAGPVTDLSHGRYFVGCGIAIRRERRPGHICRSDACLRPRQDSNLRPRD